eukprot:TRINITY_DN8322_c0_g1_i2.p1 TRINITY_DN8322_c0_g1~~TRINITY_DN8322_c0_g1_i2.p1  ORF type:complete len:131 (+),score=21.71 TRINITY_DN8322_c0_g1_i2:310-702(+)
MNSLWLMDCPIGRVSLTRHDSSPELVCSEQGISYGLSIHSEGLVVAEPLVQSNTHKRLDGLTISRIEVHLVQADWQPHLGEEPPNFLEVTPVLCVDTCLLYTSDAADEEDSVDLGGRRIIKKKKRIRTEK